MFLSGHLCPTTCTKSPHIAAPIIFMHSRREDWGLEFTDELAESLIKCAVSNGITYFDTAEGYAHGASESQLARALAKLDPAARQGVILGSKILPNNCSNVRESLTATLDRLGISSIDLYMVHWPITKEGLAHFAGDHKTKSGGHDYSTADMDAVGDIPPTTACFKELAKLQNEGKIKHIGVSNFGVEQLKEALGTGVKISFNEVCYNCIFRAIEFDVLPFCQANSIQVLCYSVLMQGILTGRYTNAGEVPQYRSRTRHFDSRKNEKSRHGENGFEELTFKTVDAIRKIAKAANISMSELAIAWPLAQPGISNVIVGGTKLAHVESAAQAGKLELPQTVIDQVEVATRELKEAMGSNCDLWQGVVDGIQTSRCK